MLVGHLPFLQKLLAFMLTGSSDHQIMKFQYSGIICLEKDSKIRQMADKMDPFTSYKLNLGYP